MTFADLYGPALDHELGSYDTTQLFTTVRRKYAVNRAQKEFARLGKISLSLEVQALLTTPASGHFNLDLLSNNRFVAFGRPPITLVITTIATGEVRASRCELRSTAYLDETTQSSWRNTSSRGVPEQVAFDPLNGKNWLTCVPLPQVPATETWVLNVPIQGNAADMTLDLDVPFDGRPDLEPFHWGIAHYAAAQLERLRKDPDAEKNQIAKFGAYVEDWNAKSTRPPGTHKRVLMQRDYLGEVARARGGITVQGDPRV